MTLDIWFKENKRRYNHLTKYYIHSTKNITQVILVKQDGKRIRINYANVNSIEEV